MRIALTAAFVLSLGMGRSKGRRTRHSLVLFVT
jgi:hypothetical protein